MQTIARRLETDYPQFDTNWSVNVEPLRESLVSEVRTSVLVLLGAVGLLLAVACANWRTCCWRVICRGAARWRGGWRLERAADE